MRGPPHNPGQGGWPTIRYYNHKTGLAGGSYKQKLAVPICQELRDNENMIDYVEEYGNTHLCATDGSGCTEKELDFLEKMKASAKDELAQQHEKLEGMMEKPMVDHLRDWVVRRKRIVKKLTDEL